MGRRRASTSQLEVKHGNFSAIKSPNRSRAASPAASPRASPSPTASPNRRLSEGSQVKDVGLMREAYSKARNMLLAKRASREEAEDEGHEGHEEHEDGGFKRVGKALVTGMSHALFNRRGSNKNQGLMKSLMAAISKEKILSRISELDLDEQVSDMLGEMYQGMIELLIDNYEPLEGALGELLDEAVTGSQDLEPFIDNLRDAVTGSLVAMRSKQEPLGVGITRPQEILLDRVVEAAQGMASEISYTMRMRGGNKKRNSAPSTSQNLGDGGTGSSRFHSSAGLGFGSSSSGHSTRVTRVAGVNSASASAFGANHGGEAAHHFKKTVRNMFAMNAMGGSGPHFHTERRAEERKHHQPGGHGSEDAEGWEEEGLHSTNLGQTSQALSPQKEAAEAEAMDATNVSQTQDLGDGPHVPAGSTQVTFQSLSTSSRGSSGSGQRPNTVAVEQSSEGVSSRSPSSRKSFAQSYGMQPSSPSSGSGFSSPSNSMSITSPMSSKARADATRSLNPFGFLDTATDEALSKETPQSGEGRAGASGIQHATTDETSKGLERLLVDSDQALPEVTSRQENVEAHPMLGDQTQLRRQPPKGRGGQLFHGPSGRKLWPDVAKRSVIGQSDRGDLYIGHHPGKRGNRKGPLSRSDDQAKQSRTDKVSSWVMPPIDASRDAASGNDADGLESQSFDWETLRVQLLREGIKLKIPPELLYKKGMKSREQSQALLEEVHSECHEAAFKEGIARLDESSKDLEASLSGLRRDSSGKSLHGTSTWHSDAAHTGQANLFSAQPVSASCNASLHRAWKSQDPVELEAVYKQRAFRWTTSGARTGALPETKRHVPSLALVPLLGQRGRQRRRRSWRKEERPASGARRFKHPILPFRSTCFDFSTDRLLPEIVTFPMVTEDFMDSVYSLSLEHSRASWSDTNTLIESAAKPVKTAKRGCASKSLQNFHKHFKSVMP